MEINGINCNRELVVLMSIDDLNDYIDYLKLKEAEAYHKGWVEAVGEEDANAQE